MKQILFKKVALVALLFCAIPSALFAQADKEKTKEKVKQQQIIITRTGDKEEKTVIEIDGDKVKVNGKDVADLKDIQVHINSLVKPNVFNLRTPNQGNFNMTFSEEDNRFFKVDSNRAMLGINSNGHDKGAQIESVVAGSAAEKAGLKKGDIITKIDNRKIDATDDVTDAVKTHKPGDKIAVTYLRDDKEYKATAELSRWKGMSLTGTGAASNGYDSQLWQNNLNGIYEPTAPVTRLRNQPAIAYGFPAKGPKLGMSVQDTDEGKGVKVLEIDDQGAAAKAGVKEGDLLLQIDGQAVNSADEVARLVKEKKEQPSMKFGLTRDGKAQTVEIRYPKKIKTVDL